MAYDHRRYRSQLRRDAKERSRGRRRGRGRHNYFKLNTTGTTVRLIPGNHMCFDGVERPFFVKRTHYDVAAGKTRDCMGSECIPCHDRERREKAGEKRGKKGRDIKQRFNRPSSKYVYSMIHLANYHKIEKDRDDGDGTYTVYEQCEGRRCKMCRRDEEKVFGRRLHWTLNESDHDVLVAYDDSLATLCECGEGEIDYKAYRCDGCDRVLRDAEDFEGSVMEFVALGFDDFKCRHCGKEDLPVPEISCVTQDEDDEWVECCDNPRPANLFCVDLEVKGIEKRGRGDVSWLGLQVIGHELEELDERVEEFAEPFDFDTMFDMDLETQSRILDMPIPKSLLNGGEDDDEYDEDDDEDEYEDDVDY